MAQSRGDFDHWLGNRPLVGVAGAVGSFDYWTGNRPLLFPDLLAAVPGTPPTSTGAGSGQLARDRCWPVLQIRVKSGGTGGTLGVSAVAQT